MESTRVEVTPEDQAVILEFMEQAHNLGEHSVIKNKRLHPRFTLSADDKGELVADFNKIDIETLESYLVRLRRFMLEKDRCYFPQVTNLISKYASNAEHTSGSRP